MYTHLVTTAAFDTVSITKNPGNAIHPFAAVPPPSGATGGTRCSGVLVAHRPSTVQELRVVLYVIELAVVVVEVICRSLLLLRFPALRHAIHTARQAIAICHAAGVAVDVSNER
eukprot:5446432-Heterocapsa_arctica.AAC.1